MLVIKQTDKGIPALPEQINLRALDRQTTFHQSHRPETHYGEGDLIDLHHPLKIYCQMTSFQQRTLL